MHKSWGNAIEFDEAAERMGVDVMRWMFARAPARGQHPLRLARGRRGATRAAHPVERVRVLRDLRAARGLDAGAPGRAAGRGARRRWIAGSCRGPRARGGGRGPPRATTTPWRRRGISTLHRRPLDLVPPPVPAADVARRDGADRDAAFATLHAALVALARSLAPILPFLAESMYANLVRPRSTAAPGQRPPDRVARRRAGAAARRAARGGDGDRPRAVELARTLRGAGRAQGPPAAGPLWLALPGGDLPNATRCSTSSATKSTSRPSSSSATSRSSSTGGSSRCCRRSARSSARRSRP